MQTAGGGTRPLFGGSMSAVFPSNATDVSVFRDIPDNQEVFAHAHTDQSLIVELVEYQADVADPDAARFHLEDIAGSNGAVGASEVTGVLELPRAELSLVECSSAWKATGAQRVAKFNEETRNAVTVHLGVFRLPQFSTDVLITFNDPQSISPGSSSAALAEAHREPWTLQDFQRLLQTVTLNDPGLFG
ncbi:ran guanine nucleotide release factor [Oryzias latipes]|uniref:RAN guanine nucleotide release factor n=1 Tax=Oryzias latipes TaxID=8090 RepID=H2L926_ORYLA|nr:ran guanine nucleotide release factor [Oryzias latipes]